MMIAAISPFQSIWADVPQSALLVLFVVPPTLFSLFGLYAFRKVIPLKFLNKNHDVTGPFFTTFGTVYGIFIAFVFSATWQSFSRTSDNVVQEARYLRDLYFVSKAFPQPQQEQIQKLLREYRDSLVNDEWRSLEKGKANQKTREVLGCVANAYLNFTPTNDHEKEFLHTSIQYLTSLTGLRASRIDDAKSSIPTTLWMVILVGACATIFSSYLFEAQNFYLQAVMTVLLTLIIFLTFYVIIDLDFPFVGSTVVSSEPFQNIEMH